VQQRAADDLSRETHSTELRAACCKLGNLRCFVGPHHGHCKACIFLAHAWAHVLLRRICESLQTCSNSVARGTLPRGAGASRLRLRHDATLILHVERHRWLARRGGRCFLTKQAHLRSAASGLSRSARAAACQRRTGGVGRYSETNVHRVAGPGSIARGSLAAPEHTTSHLGETAQGCTLHGAGSYTREAGKGDGGWRELERKPRSNATAGRTRYGQNGVASRSVASRPVTPALLRRVTGDSRTPAQSDSGMEEALATAKALLADGSQEAASKAYDVLAPLQSTRHAHVHFLTAIALQRMGGRDRDAAAQYEESLRLCPELIYARVNLVQLYTSVGQLDAALLHAEEAVLREPLNGDRRWLQALVLERAGQAEAAQRALQRCLALDPRNIPAYVNLDALYLKAGKLKESRALAGLAIREAERSKGVFSLWSHPLQRPPHLRKARHHNFAVAGLRCPSSI